MLSKPKETSSFYIFISSAPGNESLRDPPVEHGGTHRHRERGVGQLFEKSKIEVIITSANADVLKIDFGRQLFSIPS